MSVWGYYGQGGEEGIPGPRGRAGLPGRAATEVFQIDLSGATVYARNVEGSNVASSALPDVWYEVGYELPLDINLVTEVSLTVNITFSETNIIDNYNISGTFAPGLFTRYSVRPADIIDPFKGYGFVQWFEWYNRLPVQGAESTTPGRIIFRFPVGFAQTNGVIANRYLTNAESGSKPANGTTTTIANNVTANLYFTPT